MVHSKQHDGSLFSIVLLFVSGTLLHMRMIIDVVNAVAKIAGAFGAVAEFQIGAICVGAAANGTFMTVGTRAGCTAIIVCPVGIWLCIDFGRCNRSLMAYFTAPRKQIHKILSEEEQIVQEGNNCSGCKPYEKHPDRCREVFEHLNKIADNLINS